MRYLKAPMGRFPCPLCGVPIVGYHRWFYWVWVGCLVAVGATLVFLGLVSMGIAGGGIAWAIVLAIALPVDKYLEARFAVMRPDGPTAPSQPTKPEESGR
jgi:hypothetical protein